MPVKRDEYESVGREKWEEICKSRNQHKSEKRVRLDRRCGMMGSPNKPNERNGSFSCWGVFEAKKCTKE